MQPIRTRAVLLKQVDTGESNRVVTLLTEEMGKVAALARGARKSRKRFGAALGLFVLAEAELRRRSSGGLHTLSAYDALATFPRIALDLGAIAHASYVTELVGELCPTGHAEPPMFELLLETYAHLDAHPPRPETLRVLEFRALSGAGLEPQLDACVRCGRGTPGDPGEGRGLRGFDVDKGGVVCSACCREPEGITGETHAALRRLATLPLLESTSVSWSESTRAELRRTLGGAITSTLGRPLKSVQFIRKVTGPLPRR